MENNTNNSDSDDDPFQLFATAVPNGSTAAAAAAAAEEEDGTRPPVTGIELPLPPTTPLILSTAAVAAAVNNNNNDNNNHTQALLSSNQNVPVPYQQHNNNTTIPTTTTTTASNTMLPTNTATTTSRSSWCSFSFITDNVNALSSSVCATAGATTTARGGGGGGGGGIEPEKVHELFDGETSSTTTTTTITKIKTIYLIRHAESEENVNMHGLQASFSSLYTGQLPSSQSVSQGLSFITKGATGGDTDSNVSTMGKEQIQDLRRILVEDSQSHTPDPDPTTTTVQPEDSLLNTVDVIGHSPLIRAKETCYGAFDLGTCTVNNTNTTTTENEQQHQHHNHLNSVVYELSCLEEATPWETVVQGRKNTVHKRIEELQRWIEEQPDDVSTIALVGHSEYFMLMLGISRAEKFWNCDVWQVQYQYQYVPLQPQQHQQQQQQPEDQTMATTTITDTGSSTIIDSSNGRWSNLQLKHRSKLSKPMGMM